MGAGRYLQCSGCGRHHSQLIWEGGKNGFGNWLGMICPDCGGTVPRVWNFLSLAILAVTFPIWWLALRLYGERWRRRHRATAKARRDELNATGSATLSAPNSGPRVHGLLGQGHCPYCRDHVDRTDGVACASCLSRHHEECWDEHAQCAGCGATTRFTGIEQTPGRGPPRREKEKE